MLRVGLLIIAGLLFFATPALAQSSQTVMVERVVDGDTIEVNSLVSGGVLFAVNCRCGVARHDF
jgi:hypothetical protein